MRETIMPLSPERSWPSCQLKVCHQPIRDLEGVQVIDHSQLFPIRQGQRNNQDIDLEADGGPVTKKLARHAKLSVDVLLLTHLRHLLEDGNRKSASC